ncbi:GTPase HflX [Candidatus Epulonipiscium viviparus]|uniref:GTPase HflX n=1 Tax=Candidatus Epulonipiscium viviparus TaxID=420336 RepID=UPI002738100F|nr:GTPase HflX [Candidatus Epulopiscium viviparus]
MEQVIIFVAQKKLEDSDKAIAEGLEELRELVETAGASVIGELIQKVDKINAKHYLGTGKIEELKLYIEEVGATGVVCDTELSPLQMKNLSEILDTKVMDRTLIILDIFAQRATSSEGKLQVEMAQLKYQYSRLAGTGISMSRQAGGIGSKGPGEKKLELDKRNIRKRMDVLEKELAEVKRHREIIRKKRVKEEVRVVSIVGYTNAGKSTLLNVLTGSDIYVEKQLFATLDTTTRKAILPSGTEVRFVDTVGFIKKLPHQLIKAFYSTLEEVRYSDIIIHLIDASNEHNESHIQVVEETLKNLKIEGIPVLKVYNKVDNEQVYIEELENLTISAKTGLNLDKLQLKIEEILYDEMKKFTAVVPYTKNDIVAYCNKYGEKIVTYYQENGVKITGFLHFSKIYKIKPFISVELE